MCLSVRISFEWKKGEIYAILPVVLCNIIEINMLAI